MTRLLRYAAPAALFSAPVLAAKPASPDPTTAARQNVAHAVVHQYAGETAGILNLYDTSVVRIFHHEGAGPCA